MIGSGLHGVLVVDKPTGISSAKAVARIKRLLNVKKIGHAGTLDPFAHGVLVCCINDATKLARFLLHGDKSYVAALRLGQETDTQDATGNIVAERDLTHLTEKSIRSVFERFKGRLEQQPPVYSALKHKGTPLYKLARRGQPVQKPPRPVYISDIRIKEINLPLIRFEVTCSAGTYIRMLGADIGKLLGCGGHLQALQRIACCGFSIDQAVELNALERLAAEAHVHQLMIRMADALPQMPAHCVGEHIVAKIRHGIAIPPADVFDLKKINSSNGSQPHVKIIDANRNLIAIAEYRQENSQLKYCRVFHC